MPDCGHIRPAARRETPGWVLARDCGALHFTAGWREGANFGKLHVHG